MSGPSHYLGTHRVGGMVAPQLMWKQSDAENSKNILFIAVMPYLTGNRAFRDCSFEGDRCY